MFSSFFLLTGAAALSFAGPLLFAQDASDGPSPGTDSTPPQPRVTMEFRRAELVEVIQLLAKQAGANVVIDPDVKGEVTMRFSDVPWTRALQAVVKTSGYALIEEDRGRIIRVVNPASLQSQMESRVFTFKHIKPYEYYKASVPMSRSAGAPPLPPAPIKAVTLLDTLRNMLTRPPAASANSGGPSTSQTLGRLDYFKDGNCIIVVDTKPVLDRMEEIIRQVDVEPVQVLLDVVFLRTCNADFIQMFTNWSTGADVGITMGGGPTDVDAGALDPTSAKYPFHVGPWSKGAPAVATHRTSLDDHDLTVILRLCNMDPDTEYIQRPNVATRSDDQGTRIFFDEGAYDDDPKGAMPGPGVLQVVANDAYDPAGGYELHLIPHIVVGTTKIILTIIPEDQTLKGSTSTVALPLRHRATIVTHLLLEADQTMIFGEHLTERMGQTPIDGTQVQDVNLRDDELSRDHIFILVTPHISHPR